MYLARGMWLFLFMANDLIATTREDKAKKAAERKRKRELSDIRLIIKSPEGRRFIWRLLEKAGIFVRSYTGEVNSTMFNEGKREIGNWMFSELFDANPNAFTQLSQEHDSEVESEKRLEEMEENQSTSLV